jgi:aldehyde:ferredoxin oxidoreductase
MTYYGYAGKELYVDLTSGSIEKKPLDLGKAVKFLGGTGIQLRLIYDLLKPGTDPFSPEAPIIIGSGPLVGTAAPGTPRVLATLKYPETGAIGSGAGAMRFGFMLKLAGYDHIIVTGKASKPVYLKIIDDDVEICDASHLWGKDLVETAKALWQEYGDCGVIPIGQAGENQGVITLTMVDNAASLGRGGLGGVMGSKNLKALVAKGGGSIKIADPERFKKTLESMFERVRRYPYHADIVRYGIMTNWPNYSRQFSYVKNRTAMIDPNKLNKIFEASKKVGKRALSCPSCFIADKEAIEVKEGRFKGLKWSTPSLLNACLFDIIFDFEDFGEAIKFTDLMDRYGLDQISFSGMLDFLLTLYEEGLITQEDVGGLPLNRGIDTIITWAEKVAFRDGFGGVFANGWKGLMEKFGEDFIRKQTEIIKGREGAWDPRCSGLGTNEFAQLVYPRGPQAESGGSGLYVPDQPIEQVKRHGERMGMSEEQIKRASDSPLKLNIGRLTTSSEHWLAIFNSLGICNRHVNNRFYHINICSELYSAATGVELSPQQLMLHADRVWNLLKMVNVREGFSRKDDEPPEKWFEPIRTHDGKEVFMMDYFNTKRLSREDVDRWLDDYYDERGWDIETGIPTEKKLTELGLKDLVPDLNRAKL